MAYKQKGMQFKSDPPKKKGSKHGKGVTKSEAYRSSVHAGDWPEHEVRKTIKEGDVPKGKASKISKADIAKERKVAAKAYGHKKR
jgi:hypothetical protein